jgi:hypothetical protein
MPRPLACLAVVACLCVIAAAPAPAQQIDQDMDHDQSGCVYDRQVYPDGAERCQDGARMRCDAGAWDEIGACVGGAPQAPIPGGGDAVDADD